MEAQMKEIVQQRIEEMKDNLGSLSRDIWSNPELGNEEHFAHYRLARFFHEEAEGWTVVRHFHLPTAFRATWGPAGSSYAAPVINVCFLCEYDALPGIGHACGHNLIAEVGVAAALGLKAAVKGRTDLPAPVKITVIGTPAEESTGGKIDLLKAGAFVDIDVVFMAHPGLLDISFMPFSALDEMEVEFKGKASHAGVAPWEGVNALDAAVVAYNSISVLRQQLKQDWRVHGIIKEGGVKPNIIPAKTVLAYSVRAPNLSDLRVLRTKVEACFKAAAAATGCEVDLKYPYNSYYNMLSNATLGSLYEKNGTSLGIEFVPQPFNLPGSTDFGNVSHVIPGIHTFFGIGTTTIVHQPEYTEAAGSEAAQMFTLRTAKNLAMTAVDVVASSEVLQQVRKDFAEAKQKEGIQNQL